MALKPRAQFGERERATGKHLPIIALTAHAMKGDEQRCVEAGMDGYVSKPLQTADLFAAIERCSPSLLNTEDQPEPPARRVIHSKPGRIG
jgi:CheY-like chemotaxis protein